MGKQCQRRHWPSHKGACFTSKELGMRKKVARQSTVKACSVCSRTVVSTGKRVLKCDQCLAVRYCSKKCQKSDWPRHKKVCVPEGGGKKVSPLNASQKKLQDAIVKAEHCKRAGDSTGEVNEYYQLSAAYLELGQFDKAISFAEKNLAIASEVGDRAGQGTAYGNLGIASLSLSQFDKAILFLEKHLALEVGDRAGQGKAYGNLGNAYHSLGQYDKAISFT